MARLLENQALDFLKQQGVPVPAFEAVSSPNTARDVAVRLGGRVVVKALISVGGRGKAGAIKMGHTPDEACEQAHGPLGRSISNFPVGQLLVRKAVAIVQEFFVSLTFDSVS